VFLGVISSIASDAGYLVLIPLGAAAFASVGRHPLAGMAAAFAGVAGGFGVNLPHHPDRCRAHRDHQRVDPAGRPAGTIDLTANLWFGIGSTIVLTVLLGVMTSGSWSVGSATTTRRSRTRRATRSRPADDAPESTSTPRRRGGLSLGGTSSAPSRSSCCSPLPPGAPLRDPETGSIIGTSPFMNSLIVIIAILFFAAGVGYGRGRRHAQHSNRGHRRDHQVVGGPGGLLLLFLLIAQFIAYFNYSNMPQVAAVKLGDPSRA
jgi:aminobenzoyl-glutamate transport protein